jgi:hypothetical protein
MILPKEPGLSRRLSYGNYIRALHSNRYRYSNNNNFTIQGIHIEPIEIEPVELSYPLEFEVDNYNYDEVFDKIGLSLEELISCSEIRLEDSSFFCCICQDQDKLSNLQIVRKIKCNHSFHINCIEKWLSKNKSCPMCRIYLGTNF